LTWGGRKRAKLLVKKRMRKGTVDYAYSRLILQ